MRQISGVQREAGCGPSLIEPRKREGMRADHVFRRLFSPNDVPRLIRERLDPRLRRFAGARRQFLGRRPAKVAKDADADHEGATQQHGGDDPELRRSQSAGSRPSAGSVKLASGVAPVRMTGPIAARGT